MGGVINFFSKCDIIKEENLGYVDEWHLLTVEWSHGITYTNWSDFTDFINKYFEKNYNLSSYDLIASKLDGKYRLSIIENRDIFLRGLKKISKQNNMFDWYIERLIWGLEQGWNISYHQ